MPAYTTQRDERIDLRVSAELKTLLSRAAVYSGMSLVELSHFYLIRRQRPCAWLSERAGQRQSRLGGLR